LIPNIGYIHALTAYFIWGLFPLYWSQLRSFNALDIMSLRVIGGGLILSLFFMLKKKKSIRIEHIRKNLVPLIGTSLFLGLNWSLYIWAVVNGHIVETSLAYFLSPLFKVAMGLIFLKEVVTKNQKRALFLVLMGVCIFAIDGIGSLWIVLVMAFSFSLLGLYRKKYEIKAFEGLLFEHLFLIIPFFIYNNYWGRPLHEIFLYASGRDLFFLSCAGVVSVAPLLFFGKALSTLKLGEVALIQYLAPTMQLFTGVYIYAEPFGLVKMVSFSVVWLGLIYYFPIPKMAHLFSRSYKF